jgi:hypothetical protein
MAFRQCSGDQDISFTWLELGHATCPFDLCDFSSNINVVAAPTVDGDGDVVVAITTI